ncbi:MAG: AAA family ATPase [Chloroflexaceae bacterium]|nr:AAA family ATPase [Chloroflexaceae bacterium]
MNDESARVYLPIDRRLALLSGQELPDQADGTVLFTDIVGFTPLTETLLRQFGPRRGAEELTHRLNLVYNTLIAEVHRYSGSVISFSGDAMLCWFAADTGLRASTCGMALQQAMNGLTGQPVFEAPALPIAIKVALASGSVRRFVVGNPDIQLLDVLAGATLDHMAAAEKQAQKGETVLDQSTWTNVQHQVTVREWRVDPSSDRPFAVLHDVLHPAAPKPWDMTAALSDEQVRPWLLRPVYAQLVSQQGQFLAEMRLAVALFLSFSGIDYDHDPDAGSLLDTYIRRVQQILERYEGFLLQVSIGDKGSYLYGAFGAPLAHDDDPLRAVAAALELQQIPVSLPGMHHLRIGISQGYMRSGAYGGTMRSTYGVMGDEVNLAARLMSRAQSAQTLVSQRIVNATSSSYRYESMGLVRLKGKQLPIPVARLLGTQQHRLHKAFETSSTVLVGRDTELRVLDQRLAAVQQGNGQIVVLEGAAGVGKSHLILHASAQAADRGFQVLTGFCQMIHTDMAYSPWKQMMRTLLGLDEQLIARGTEADYVLVEQLTQTITRLNPDWLLRLPLLGDLLDLPIADNATTASFEPRRRQESLSALVVDILLTYAHQTPILLVLDDLHWIDESSLSLIHALSRVVNQSPILLLLAHRPVPHMAQTVLDEWNGTPYGHHLRLSELPLPSIEQLITHQLGHPVAPLLLSLIQIKAQGNPFFTQELVHAMREAGTICQRQDGLWWLAQSVFEALQHAHYLMRHPQYQYWVVQPDTTSISVDLGVPDSIQSIVLARLDRLPEGHKLSLKVASVIGRLFECAVLEQAHPNRPGQTTLLEHMDVLEQRDFVRLEQAQRLSYVFRHDITREVAYDTLLYVQRQELHLAVAEVIEQLSPESVETLAYHYSRTTARDKLLWYLDKAARIAQREYANETALEYYQQALAYEERWAWRREQINILHTLGRRDAEYMALRQASPSADPAEVAYLWGAYYEAIGQYDDALQATEEALHVASTLQHANDSTLQTYLLRSRIAYVQGHFEHSLINAQKGLEIAEKNGAVRQQAQALQRMGIIWMEQGHFAQSIEALQQACQLFEQENQLDGLTTALNSLGIVYQTVNRWQDTMNCYMRSRQLSEHIGDQLMFARTSNNLGLVLMDRGDLEGANQLYQQSTEQFRRIGYERGMAHSILNRGEVRLLQDYPAEAMQLLNESLTLLERVNSRIDLPENLRLMAEAALAMNNLEQATAYANQSLAMARELGQPLESATAMRVLGNIALVQSDMATAGRLFEASRQELERLGNLQQLARTLCCQAHYALQQHQHEAAQQLVQQAEAIFTELDAQYDLMQMPALRERCFPNG